MAKQSDFMKQLKTAKPSPSTRKTFTWKDDLVKGKKPDEPISSVRWNDLREKKRPDGQKTCETTVDGTPDLRKMRQNMQRDKK